MPVSRALLSFGVRQPGIQDASFKGLPGSVHGRDGHALGFELSWTLWGNPWFPASELSNVGT